MNVDVPYAISKRLQNTDMSTARTKTEAALKAEGFGILTEIDVQTTLKKKLDVDTEPYVILGACNPELAHRALSETPAIGLLLPCNVVLARDGEDVIVAAASPKSLFNTTGADTSTGGIADEAEACIRRAVAAL